MPLVWIVCKMLRLTICLLVARTVFAASAFPMGNTGYHPVGPDTNLVFNFQQIRRDQPAQVEMREENIHKYMNRPRTTPPTPIDNGDMSSMHPENPIPYTAEQWNAVLTAPKYEGPVANWKNVPAPPSFPHWDNLAVNNPNNYEQYRQSIVVPEEPAQWQQPEIRSRAMPSYSTTFEPVTFAPVTFAPVTFAPREPVTFAPRAHARHSSRGNHRFNWNDVSTTQAPTTMPVNAPTAAPSRMPPPPVPTLSPWYDGF
ncbi:uncharacterized protein LOC125226554 [Leguminivora glycinivorella]|uniref:uncharacterized protein LOC125226554 n=1 Tax=Leguminivora glycinivorella TaxID=1035111 RepID=UPI002010C6BA|nr:uncharacterized protein LOC125226554 [Leguminivora glycinivorella]